MASKRMLSLHPALGAVAALLVVAAASPSVAAAGTGESCSLFGSKAASGDADLFYPLVASFGQPAFVDNGNGFFNAGEPAYLDSDFSGTVSPSDVRLTGAPGSVVVPGDLDISAPFVVLPGTPAFVDADGSATYNGPDLVYWDVNSDGFVGPADLRLTPTLGGPAGTAVVLGDADVGNLLLSAFAQFTYFDGDADGTFTAADTAYLSFGGFQVQPADVRLSGAPTLLVAEPVVSTTTGSIFGTPAFRATLTSGGAPVAGAAIGFYVGGDLVCSAPTDGSGTAACGSYFERFAATAAGGYEARFAGAFPRCGSAATGTVTA